jgi:hypothetical protein
MSKLKVQEFGNLCHLSFGFNLTFASLPVGRDFDIWNWIT